MKWLDISQGENSQAAIEAASAIIRTGGIVAFPTETVYGLGADAFCEPAVRRVFEIKGRKADNPLIVHVADMKDLDRFVEEIKPWARQLMAAFWPGTLSIVLKRKPGSFSDVVTGGLGSVAVRMPDNKATLALIRACKTPLVGPSANLSGSPSPTKAVHVKQDFDDRIEAILVDDAAYIGIESTVVDGRGDFPVILRPGAITLDMLRDVVGQAALQDSADVEVPRSPGMKYAHYQPKARVWLVDGDGKAEKIRRFLAENEHTGLFLSSELAHRIEAPMVITYDDTIKAAQLFYAALREFDEAGVAAIVCEVVDESGLGYALMNRMKKSADNHYIQ